MIGHRRRNVLNIGGGGGKVQNIGGSRGVANFFAGCNLIGAPAPNQCQIITFLTLKTDNIAKLRIGLKSILLERVRVSPPPKKKILGGGGAGPLAPLPPPPPPPLLPTPM